MSTCLSTSLTTFLSQLRPPKPRGSILVIVGLMLCSIGLALGAGRPAHAQDTGQTPAEYVGSQQCSSCHKQLSRNHSTTGHALALQDASSDKDLIQADFKTGEKERTVLFPDGSKPRAFTPDDVAYVIGSGRYVERYLYKASRTKYLVFPAEWNVEKKTWQPYIRGDSASKWAENAAYDWTQNCAGCHTTGLNVKRSRWTDDGVQCEACHGPGSNHTEAASRAGSDPSASDLKEVHDAIVVSPDSQICGQCHSQGTEPESKLPYPVTYVPGANLLDKAVFGLVATDSKDHWWQTGHAKQPNMQFNEWMQSGHSKSLATLKSSPDAAPACLECHSGDFALNNRLLDAQKAGTLKVAPLQPLTLESAKSGVGCVSCHDPHVSTRDEPVKFDLASGDAYTQCTSCHRATDVTKSLHHPAKEMFEGQPLVKNVPGVSSAHFAAANGPRCQTCHMAEVPVQSFASASHLFLPVLPGKADGKLPDSCSGCHSKLTPTDLQSLIDDTRDAVRGRLSVAFARLATVTKPAPGSALYDRYNQVIAALAFVQNEGSLGVHNYAYADALLTASEHTLAELSVPGSVAQPTEAPAPTATFSVPQVTLNVTTPSIPSGIRPMTVLSIGMTLLIALIGAVAFFRKSSHGEA